MLFIDQLRSNPNAAITIDSGGVAPLIKAFIMEDFNFGGKNSFNSALEAILGGKLAGATHAGSAALQDWTTSKNLAAGLTGKEYAARTLSGGDSVSTWVSSDRPAFSLNMLFLAINNGDDPRTAARNLLSFVYPSGDPNGVLLAPLGYVASFNNSGKSKGRCRRTVVTSM